MMTHLMCEMTVIASKLTTFLLVTFTLICVFMLDMVKIIPIYSNQFKA